jgi:methylated-DNA-[protein]-cysteine S-methyltransferase
VEDQLEQFFSGELKDFNVEVELVGTEFQRTVWSALKGIAYGCTATYAEIAKRCLRPRAVRAVGAAIGRNPISILIPCHRVVATNGSLAGFAGGLARKQWLLDNERSGGVASTAPPPLVEVPRSRVSKMD